MTLNNAALDEATRTPEKFGFLAHIGGPQFIAAQIFTIVATILGVYLAGYVGFQRTLEYDRYTKAQQQADVINAVHAELKDNAARVKDFANRIDPTSGNMGDWPRLRLYVWHAAGQTTSAFDIPQEALSGMQAFYDEVGETLSNPKIREWFRSTNAFFASDKTQMKDGLLRHIRTVETSILPSLQNAESAPAELITKYGQAAR